MLVVPFLGPLPVTSLRHPPRNLELRTVSDERSILRSRPGPGAASDVFEAEGRLHATLGTVSQLGVPLFSVTGGWRGGNVCAVQGVNAVRSRTTMHESAGSQFHPIVSIGPTHGTLFFGWEGNSWLLLGFPVHQTCETSSNHGSEYDGPIQSGKRPRQMGSHGKRPRKGFKGYQGSFRYMNALFPKYASKSPVIMLIGQLCSTRKQQHDQHAAILVRPFPSKVVQGHAGLPSTVHPVFCSRLHVFLASSRSTAGR